MKDWTHRLRDPSAKGPTTGSGRGCPFMGESSLECVLFGFLWAGLLSAILPIAGIVRVGGDEGIELGKAMHWLRLGNWEMDWWNDQPLTHTKWYAALIRLEAGPFLPRLWSLLHLGVLLVGVGWVTESLFLSSTAVRGAVGMVALSPVCLDLSISAMQEIPTTAWGMVTLACALRCAAGAGWIWWVGLIVAGALSAAIKLTGFIYGLTAVGWIAACGLRLGRTSRSPIWRCAIGSGVAMVLGAWAVLACVDGRSWAFLLGPHLVSWRATADSESTKYPGAVAGLMTHAWPVVGLAVLGFGRAAIFGTARARSDLRKWVALILPGMTFQVLIRPWWGYYAVAAVALLAPAAGAAIAYVGCLMRSWESQVSSVGPTVVRAAFAACVGVAVLSAGLGWLERCRLWRDAPRASDSAILRSIRRFQSDGPAGCLYSTDAMDAVWSEVPVPADLLVITEKRFLSGSLSRDAVPRILRESGCDFIVLSEGLSASRSAPWNELLSHDYVRVLVSEGKELFVHRELNPVPDARRLRW